MRGAGSDRGTTRAVLAERSRSWEERADQLLPDGRADSNASVVDCVSEPQDVFLAHAGQQKAVVAAIREAFLKQHPELRVFLDDPSVGPGQLTMPVISNACRSASLGVALVSREFVRKENCMAELRILLDRLREATGLLIPVLYGGLTPEAVKNMRGLYDSEEWCVDQGRPDSETLDAWAADLRALKEVSMIRCDKYTTTEELVEIVVKEVVKLLGAAGKLPPRLEVHSVLGQLPPVQLVGRQQQLEDAFSALLKGRYVEVFGGPGEGKSFLVQHLVERVCVHWRQQPAPGKGGKLAHALCVDLRGVLGEQAAGRRDLVAWLLDVVASKLLGQVKETAESEQWHLLNLWLKKQEPAPVLIVLESAEQCVAQPAEGGETPSLVQAFQELLDRLFCFQHVLLVVATRFVTRGISYETGAPAGSVVKLEQLDGSSGMHLLDSRLHAGQKLSAADEPDRRAAARLVQLVGSNPLALTVAAGLVNKGSTWQDLLQRASKEQGISALNPRRPRDPPGMKGYMDALKTWLSPCLQPIEWQLLASVCVFPGSFTAGGAAAVSPNVPADELADTLQELVDMSLLRQRPAAGVSSSAQPHLTAQRYAVHALVRDVALQSDSAAGGGAQDAAACQLARWMLQAGEGPGQVLLRCQQADQPDVALRSCLLSEELQNFAAAGGGVRRAAGEGDTERLLAAAGSVGWELSVCGHGHVAKLLQQPAVEAAEQRLGAQHAVTLSSKHNLAVTLKCMGELEAAKRLEEEVLEGEVLSGCPRELGMLRTKHNLASTLSGIEGKLNETQQHQEEVLEAFTRLLGPAHPDTLVAKNNLANTLCAVAKGNLAHGRCAAGQMEQAKRLQEEVLEVRRRQLGNMHLETAGTIANLAVTLNNMGRPAEGRQLVEEALAVFAEVLGPEHPDSLSAMANRAAMLRNMGELQEARRALGEVLEARAQVLGLEHPDTQDARARLGEVEAEMSERGAQGPPALQCPAVLLSVIPTQHGMSMCRQLRFG